MTDTTKEELKDAIWQAIKGWDIQRKNGDGYAGSTGTDVDAIYALVEAKCTKREEWYLQSVLRNRAKTDPDVTVKELYEGLYEQKHKYTAQNSDTFKRQSLKEKREQ